MLSFWVYLLSVIVLMASFFVRGAYRRGLDAVSTAGDPARHAGPCGGIVLMLVSLLIFIVASPWAASTT
jgi:cytochrome c oxidase subunit 1